MQVLVLYDGEPLYRESVGIVVRPRGVQQAAGRHEAALRDVALTDYLLGGIGGRTVGIMLEIAHHAVHFQHLRDIAGKPGRSAPLRELSPLRTVHESFLSYGSSNSKFLL